jgi:hypothetical protein
LDLLSANQRVFHQHTQHPHNNTSNLGQKRKAWARNKGFAVDLLILAVVFPLAQRAAADWCSVAPSPKTKQRETPGGFANRRFAGQDYD